ncbi:hypothetical protein E8E11_006839 [Didymella keratinophila]|nr:hypothetical protein E8E11_006839 [Didymella keratinophila]
MLNTYIAAEGAMKAGELKPDPTGPRKGYGCFALKPIPRGTRILTDTPLLIVPMADYMKADIEAAFSKLSDVAKLQYFTLHSGHGQNPADWPSQIHPSVPARERQRISEQHAARVGNEATLISIFQTNCMEMNAGAAVFLHTSRFNHSCVPNACFTWNAAIGKETIHTMRDIQQGEEITISYVDGEHGKRLRAWELRHYGLVCQCEACGDEEDESSYAYASAERRLQIQELERETQLLRGEKAMHIKRDCQGVDFPDFKKYAEAVERIKASRRREVGEANGWKA